MQQSSLSMVASVLAVALLLLAHAGCGRIGYDSVSVLSDERRLGSSDVVTPDDNLGEGGEGSGNPQVEQDGGFASSDAQAGEPEAGVDQEPANAQDAALPSSLDQGLVGYWSLDEGAGNAIRDSSGHGNHGQINGSVAWSDSPRGTVVGFSDQVTNHIRVESSGSVDGITNGVSITAWVYTLGSGWEQAILSRQRGQGADQHYSLQVFQDRIQFQLGSSRLSYAPSSFPTATWIHIAATYDGQNAKLYIDGVEVAGTARASILTADNTPVLIGSKQENQDIWSAFRGNLDSIRLYDRALAAAEVALIAR